MKFKIKKEDIPQILKEVATDSDDTIYTLKKDEEFRLEETEESLAKNKLIEKFFTRRVVREGGNYNTQRLAQVQAQIREQELVIKVIKGFLEFLAEEEKNA